MRPSRIDEEVAAEVIDGSQSVVWQQAGNRMHAVRALFAELVGGARVAQPTEGEAQPEATRGSGARVAQPTEGEAQPEATRGRDR